MTFVSLKMLHIVCIAGTTVATGLHSGSTYHPVPVTTINRGMVVQTHLSFLTVDRQPPVQIYISMTTGQSMCCRSWCDAVESSRGLNKQFINIQMSLQRWLWGPCIINQLEFSPENSFTVHCDFKGSGLSVLAWAQPSVQWSEQYLKFDVYLTLGLFCSSTALWDKTLLHSELT